MLLIENSGCGTSLVVLWLRLCAPNEGSMGSVPASGTKISHAMRPKKEKKKKTWRCEMYNHRESENFSDEIGNFSALFLFGVM